MKITDSDNAKDRASFQREYYASTADNYDVMHVGDRDEHYFALRFLEAIIDFYNIKTILDIGAGTGRVALYFKERNPRISITSIEPVPELRDKGHEKGLSKTELIDGDATKLLFKDNNFDLVCEFGVLHHVSNPEIVVSEMLRVGKIGIYISDSNNFGQGSLISRTFKQTLRATGLWKIADAIKTRGKGYYYSDGDGIAYSYSVFNNFRQIEHQCDVHLLNSTPSGPSLYRSASHVALLGIKRCK